MNCDVNVIFDLIAEKIELYKVDRNRPLANL